MTITPMLTKIFGKTKTEYDDNTIDILRLIRSENIGTKTFYNIINYYGSAKKAVENIPEFMARCGKSKYRVFSTQEAEKEIEAMDKNGAKFLTYQDEAYSELLKNTYDAPPIISYKGNIKLLKTNCAAIVGARNCSIAGKELASRIARDLSKASITVVSGLARGIDTASHLASEPNTIGVIAGGIDHIYPPENHKLYERMAKEGLIIAELPIGNSPLARHFPQRNRIISGLSQATIVIEASLNSGSLITAKFALEQNREIFAAPGFPLDPRCTGTNKLIKDGATLLESADDIIEFYNKLDESKIREQKADNLKTTPICEIVDENLLSQSNKNLIMECLSSYPASIEDIHTQTKLPIPIIMTILLELELIGKIVYQPGNKIVMNFENI